MNKTKEEYASYEEARAFIRTVNIKSRREYFEKYKEFNKQCKIRLPRAANTVYKDEWVSWVEFLSKRKYHRTKSVIGASYVSYDEAKRMLYTYAINNNMKFTSGSDFYKRFALSQEFAKEFALSIPGASNLYYKKRGTWKSWEDFLSIHTFGTMGYSEMKELFFKNKIETFDQMIEFCAEHPEYKISSDIEASCEVRGDWGGWDDLFFNKTGDNIKNKKTCSSVDSIKKECSLETHNINRTEDNSVVDDVVQLLNNAILAIKNLNFCKKQANSSEF